MGAAEQSCSQFMDVPAGETSAHPVKPEGSAEGPKEKRLTKVTQPGGNTPESITRLSRLCPGLCLLLNAPVEGIFS